MGDALILGVGNLLLSDDGVGVHGAHRLQSRVTLPERVRVLDGGTLGMALLPYLENISGLLILDAVNWGGEPGELVRLAGEEVMGYFSSKVSMHEAGVADLLTQAWLLGLYPETVVIWGIQPEKLSYGLELSPSVSARMDELLSRAMEEVCTWLQ